jgi:hypothetical protein
MRLVCRLIWKVLQPAWQDSVWSGLLVSFSIVVCKYSSHWVHSSVGGYMWAHGKRESKVDIICLLRHCLYWDGRLLVVIASLQQTSSASPVLLNMGRMCSLDVVGYL